MGISGREAEGRGVGAAVERSVGGGAFGAGQVGAARSERQCRTSVARWSNRGAGRRHACGEGAAKTELLRWYSVLPDRLQGQVAS